MFPGPHYMRFVWSRVGRALRQYVRILGICGLYAVLGPPVTAWYLLSGVSVGCCGSIHLLGYKRTFFAVFRLAKGQ